MGKAQKPKPVKLFIGFIFKDGLCLEKAKQQLIKKFGRVDFQSQALDFRHTDYYRNEFGSGLKREFISFQKLIPPDKLARIKKQTNKIEQKLSRQNKRSVNIDPGYLNFSKVVLASTKDYGHRLYLGRGIYAEAALLYKNKGFRWLEWTYPDYRTPQYLEILQKIREIYAQQIKDAP